MADVIAPISLNIGSADNWIITPRGNNRAPLANTFLDTDTLHSDVWAGGNQATIFSPSVTWVNATIPTLRLSISSLQSGAMEEGIYHIAVSVIWNSGDGQRHDVYYGLIQFNASVGTATAPTVYCTIADLRNFAPEVEKIQSRTKDLTGFLGQRHSARVEFENRVVNRYSPVPGRARRLMSADNSGPGPFMRFVKQSPDGLPPPSMVDIQNLFDTSRLIVNPTVVIANAYLAASLVFQDQIIGSGQQILEYPKLAQMYRGMWEDQFDAAIIEFDTSNRNPASLSTIQLDRDIVYLT